MHKLIRHQHWEVGVIAHPIHCLLDPEFDPIVTWMPSRGAGLFRADPFMLQVEGRQIILFEDYDYRTHVGRISASEWKHGAFHPLAADVLPIPCHLAYPFTLEYEGRTLCIPETALLNEVSVWEFDAASSRFSRVATLVSDVPAVDSTIFQHEGRWWLACTLHGRFSNDRLSLWYADDFWGNWTPHRGNPVKTDATSSRPAGTPFVHEGVLYRPAQDCSRRYGGAVTINRILQLTPDEFAEEPVRVVSSISRNSHLQGIHTLSAAGPHTLVDGLRYQFLASEALHQLTTGVGRAIRRGVRSSSSQRSRRPMSVRTLAPPLGSGTDSSHTN